MAAVGAIFTFFMLGLGGLIGLLGIAWGIIILVSANHLRAHPDQHATWGAIILVFSLISWLGGLGGLLIGFLLGLIGGIMAITWQPQVTTPPNVYQPPPTSPAPPTQATRYCSYCGAPLAADAVYCPHCGRQSTPS